MQIIKWKVKIDSQNIIFSSFSEAYNVYKEEKHGQYIWFSSISIYPIIMTDKKFNSLKEFTGY